MMKLIMPTLDIINVYRSKEQPLSEVKRLLESVVEPRKPTLVLGDFNFCYLKEKNCVSQWLEGVGCHQVVSSATHIEGGLLDHAYLLLPDETAVLIGQYDNYFTDHDTIVLLLPPVMRPTHEA